MVFNSPALKGGAIDVRDIQGFSHSPLISFGLIPRPLAAYLYSFGIDTPSACGGVVHFSMSF
jgi:hypothetical protein